MRQRQAAWVLGMVVLGLVVFGGWKWSTRRAVERTVRVFLSAMVLGDAEILVDQLDEAALEAYLAKSPAEQAEFTAPLPGARAEIREVHLHHRTARVRVLWKISGFDIWSDLELAQADTGQWKIVGIQESKMIPTWEQVRQWIKEESSQAPAHQVLSEKLEGREGVEVRPLTEAELDQ